MDSKIFRKLDWNSLFRAVAWRVNGAMWALLGAVAVDFNLHQKIREEKKESKIKKIS